MLQVGLPKWRAVGPAQTCTPDGDALIATPGPVPARLRSPGLPQLHTQAVGGAGGSGVFSGCSWSCGQLISDRRTG